jgi:hypothetical protein
MTKPTLIPFLMLGVLVAAASDLSKYRDFKLKWPPKDWDLPVHESTVSHGLICWTGVQSSCGRRMFLPSWEQALSRPAAQGQMRRFRAARSTAAGLGRK